jgi:eukaryotic-like serine/threonine-protein kinase
MGVLDIENYRPRTLSHDIRSLGRLPAGTVLPMSVALADGLQYLHAQGLVHRDIKPSNIIFVGGRPKLADVGLVAALGEPQSVVGTAGFIAPKRGRFVRVIRLTSGEFFSNRKGVHP